MADKEAIKNVSSVKRPQAPEKNFATADLIKLVVAVVLLGVGIVGAVFGIPYAAAFFGWW